MEFVIRKHGYNRLKCYLLTKKRVMIGEFSGTFGNVGFAVRNIHAVMKNVFKAKIKYEKED
jgi:hypothetical protein